MPCTRPASLYTARTRPSTRSDTARTRPCTRPVHGRVHSRVHRHTCTPPLQGRVRAIYTAVYTASTQPYTRAMYTARTRLCSVRVHGPCTRPRTRSVVHMAGRPTGPCTRSRTVAARHDRVHGPFTAHSRQCIRPYTAVYMFVYTGRVHGRVHGPYAVRP